MDENDKDLMQKIESEGGVEFALEYGITGKDFTDKEVSVAWDIARTALNNLHAMLEDKGFFAGTVG